MKYSWRKRENHCDLVQLMSILREILSLPQFGGELFVLVEEINLEKNTEKFTIIFLVKWTSIQAFNFHNILNRFYKNTFESQSGVSYA
ncbi:hypothetical protein EGR_10694 [Echinococcus granulosus]|uniref:Uncharacterized protein n=1 Tax=Echinococcus granulosus TaxID=6210 RepID=W6ULT8_ECHGR|nr:hypothetical protein EGR_10694 [Echinococcus granulosus]EUB54449.1 hypothetical protein EGR_10694 [Echinococcus granulosus]